MSSATYDTLIVGGGPAALSAALVLGRCMRKALVIDSGRYRNQRSKALHCFLGHDGVSPDDLLKKARTELRRYDTITYRAACVDGLACRGSEFVACVAGEDVRSRSVLVATGVVDELPAIKGIEEFFGRSVHVCPYCDGWEHRGAPVVVYGRGAKAARLALLLRQWTADLVLCTSGSSDLSRQEQELLQRRGIRMRETPVLALEGEDGCLRAVLFADGTRLASQALFFQTGQHARSALLQGIGCAYGDRGPICDADGATSVPGVYVAGDASRDVQLAIIAAAEGARAAIAMNSWLLRCKGFACGT
jgi:thioredoxin reductase